MSSISKDEVLTSKSRNDTGHRGSSNQATWSARGQSAAIFLCRCQTRAKFGVLGQWRGADRGISLVPGGPHQNISDQAAGNMETGSSSNDYGDAEWQQAGRNADAQDLAGPGTHGTLDCTVDHPQKEGEGTQNAYVSYLVTTDVGLILLENVYIGTSI